VARSAHVAAHARSGAERGQQILADIAAIIPLSKQGSLLRAIAHNQAQSVVLGVNQLTTGLFRALERFAQKSFAEAERERMIAERLLPHLPVYEILSTLRLYQDWQGDVLKRIEPAFPAGNSAFVALRKTATRASAICRCSSRNCCDGTASTSTTSSPRRLHPRILPTLRPIWRCCCSRSLNTSIDQLLDQGRARAASMMSGAQTPIAPAASQITGDRSSGT
jgi:hypothetical protein